LFDLPRFDAIEFESCVALMGPAQYNSANVPQEEVSLRSARLLDIIEYPRSTARGISRTSPVTWEAHKSIAEGRLKIVQRNR